MDKPQPIDSAPLGTRLLLWWTPVDSNPYAECWIIGSLSWHKPGKYWDGGTFGPRDEDGYKDLARIKYWLPLPPGPM